MKILNKTKLVLASSVLAFTLGGHAAPDSEQLSQESFRALKVTLAARGKAIDDVIVASMATGGALTSGSITFERLRGLLAGASLAAVVTPAPTTVNGGSTYLSPNPTIAGTVPTQITTAQRAAVIASRDIIDLINALTGHVVGDVLSA